MIKKTQLFFNSLCTKLSHFLDSTRCLISSSLHNLILILIRLLSPFWMHLAYFISFSVIGFLALKAASKHAKSLIPRRRPRDIDLYFMSVSAVTVSSMSTVEMEVFSNSQLIILTTLIMFGGEVFVSIVRLHFSKYSNQRAANSGLKSKPELNHVQLDLITNPPSHDENEVQNDHELGFQGVLPHCNSRQLIGELDSSSLAGEGDPRLACLSGHSSNPQKYESIPTISNQRAPNSGTKSKPENHVEHSLITNPPSHENNTRDCRISTNSVRCLFHTVVGYFVVVHVLGSSSIAAYILSSPTAKLVLENNGIRIDTFSVFATASSFSNCGFIPTNENMVVFKKNTGLLLMLTPQLLVGTSLYPPCLRLVILVLERVTKRPEFGYILKNYKELGYNGHLTSRRRSCFLGATVLGFIAIQFTVFVAMEWNSGGMEGLNWYEKAVASLFQVANTRHSGESVFDLSIVSPAVLVLFVVMMYLPPYTSFVPVEDGEEEEEVSCKRQINKYVEYLLLSQASYVVIFIILICITERHNLKEDPLNFSVLNTVIEVVSAYGNVGYTMGYSCKRQVVKDDDGVCKDTYYGFAGRWSDNGKLILIVVMFFGRLKNFHAGGGTAWKLE